MTIEASVLKEIKSQVESFPIFNGIRGTQLDLIINLSLLTNYKKDQTIFKDGDIHHAFFIILKGEVKIHIRNIKFITLKSSNYFGEYSLIEKKPHSATATAITDCQCLVIPPDIFNNILQQNIVFSSNLYRSLLKRLRSKDKLEISLTEKNIEIENQNYKIIEQNQEILNKTNQIKESIEYAGLIQSSLLPSSVWLERKLGELLMIFNPKDIVSGDFYWFAQRNNKFCLAVADCTGHGIPGSMLSILGISILNEIIDQISDTDPGNILNKLNNELYLRLNQNTKLNDGMDIALLIIDFDQKTINYSGAHNPLYIVREGNLMVFNPNKLGIGTKADQKFESQLVTIKEGDMIYIFSDGYTDQVGGKFEKRFTISRFKNLLTQISSFHVSRQKQNIIKSFEEWKQNNEQTDDITIIGFKVWHNILS